MPAVQSADVRAEAEVDRNVPVAVVVGEDPVAGGRDDVSVAVVDEYVAVHAAVEYPEISRVKSGLDSRGGAARIVVVGAGVDRPLRDHGHRARCNVGRRLIGNVDASAAGVDCRPEACGDGGIAGPIVERGDTVLGQDHLPWCRPHVAWIVVPPASDTEISPCP